jgi:type III restriction enzyme
MKLHFEKGLDYQLDAIRAVIDVFDGQPLSTGVFEYSFSDADETSLQYTERGVANRLILSPEYLLSNIQKVQAQNEIAKISKIESLNYTEDGEKKKKITADFLNLTVEMETGTGKTYVYLRSIYELNKTYGFKKFIIVVPSIAIREGVIKNLEITDDHLQEIYGRPKRNFQVYDSKKTASLRNFALSDAIEILVINIDSFTKDDNIINQVRERGIKPIEYLQAVRPIVILDEPQNMETDVRKKAIHSLNPLCALRYSATHRETYNLIYRLDPVRAYDLGLVKQIAVHSVLAENDSSAAFVSLDNITSNTKTVTAHFTLYAETAKGIEKKQVKAEVGDDLYLLSGKRDVYKDHFSINFIDKREGYVEFSDPLHTKLYKGETRGGLTDFILKEQIDATVEKHFRRELELRKQGIKVLSIFFIDRVSNYREYEDGGQGKGKFALWFEESFKKWQNYNADYKTLFGGLSPEKVHNGYFAQDKKTGQFKDSKEGAKRGATADDESAFELIMRDKERLLNIDEPLRFIFSHSALREGWDNPNVFQICTLVETRSEIKKRQEIGRGLRLAVNQDGVRVKDRSVNQLVVIANESYEDFAKQLQKEIAEDCGVQFGKERIKNDRDRIKLTLKKNYQLDENFLDLWNRIKHKTRYRVHYNIEELVKNCAKVLKESSAIALPAIRHTTAPLPIKYEGVSGQVKESRRPRTVKGFLFPSPDILNYIRNKTKLDRGNIWNIIKGSERLGDAAINPQIFMDSLVRIIDHERKRLMVDGIKYEKIAGEEFEMRLFEDREIERFKDNVIAVQKQDKTLYDYIEIDAHSTPESRFMVDCENNENILFYIKLPEWFKIQTPIGDYNPDWALIYRDESKIYFVAETKGTKDRTQLRPDEALKIYCAERHFDEFEDVEYRVVAEVEDLLV